MIETLIQADRSLFSILNGAHVSWLDPIMAFFSQTWVWIPLYLGITVLAYAFGMLLDREGREQHVAFYRAIPARVRALFKKKEQ